MGILTADRLARLARTPHLADSWYVIAAATFAVCNRPKEPATVYQYMLEQCSSSKEQVLVAQRMREALLKSSALGGLPKIINALTQLRDVTDDSLRAKTLVRSADTNFTESGQAMWNQVYGKIARRVSNQLFTAYPDLHYYALNHVYGALLSNFTVLSPRETSLVIIGCLIPQDVNPQLKGHLKGALNNGASRDEVSSARQMAIDISEWCGVEWREPVAALSLPRDSDSSS